MSISRRKFLGASGALAAGAALAPLVRSRIALGASDFKSRRVVIVGIGGGLRLDHALGMSEGATMPNLFGAVPLISGFGSGDAGPPVIAPEYEAAAPPLVLPAPRQAPLYTEGALITNLRYAQGAPGHLQGQACLVSGYYNNIENRSDARLPVPTIFEVHRRESNAPDTDAWYISNPGGFYSALQTSDHPEFGARYGGRFLSPPSAVSTILPLLASGERELDIDSSSISLPTIARNQEEDAATRRLAGILNGNTPEAPRDPAVFRGTESTNAQVHSYLAEVYGDDTYQAFYPDSVGIGLSDGGGGLNATADGLTLYQSIRVLEKFRPSVLAMTLLDIDQCHGDFNAYLRSQQLADALVSHLWDFIQSTEGLKDETTLIVLPEHGRHLFMNGNNPDSLGRSGIDHGQGDDGDRDIWMLALGPDIRPNQVLAPTGVTQEDRSSGRYESIDAVLTGAGLLGHDEVMAGAIEEQGGRPGLMIEEILR